MSASAVDNLFRATVRKEANHLMWLGGALLLIGITALVFPIVSSLVATLFVGWVLIFSGLATLYGAFSIRGAGPFFGALLLGLLSLACGVFILARPIGGELAITLCLGGLFMVQGAFEAALAFEARSSQSWGWMLVSALASVVLSLVILSGWPGVSLVALGAIIGVNFLSSGLAFLMVGASAKRDAKAAA
jgi:uncharacterized membrane protein HdeD (DUF308 family)